MCSSIWTGYAFALGGALVVAPLMAILVGLLSRRYFMRGEPGAAGPVLTVLYGVLPGFWVGAALGTWAGLSAGACSASASTAALVLPAGLLLLVAFILVALAMASLQKPPPSTAHVESSAWPTMVMWGFLVVGAPLLGAVLARYAAIHWFG